MAIRDIISQGFGNGTYDPGVNKLPTRGYTIAEVTVPNRAGIAFRICHPRPHYTAINKRPEFTIGERP